MRPIIRWGAWENNRFAFERMFDLPTEVQRIERALERGDRVSTSHTHTASLKLVKLKSPIFSGGTTAGVGS
jgi:hypothetical protein